MDATLTDREIDVHRVDEAAVVPQQDVAESPGVIVPILGLCHVLMDPVEERIAALTVHVYDRVGAIGVEVDCFLTRVLVGAHQGMNDIGRFLLLDAGAFGRAGRGAHSVVAVNRFQSVDARSHLVGEVVICFARIAEPCFATRLRQRKRLQHGRLPSGSTEPFP